MFNMNAFLPNFIVAKRYDLSRSETMKAALFGSMVGGSNTGIGVVLADRMARKAQADAKAQEGRAFRTLSSAELEADVDEMTEELAKKKDELKRAKKEVGTAAAKRTGSTPPK